MRLRTQESSDRSATHHTDPSRYFRRLGSLGAQMRGQQSRIRGIGIPILVVVLFALVAVSWTSYGDSATNPAVPGTPLLFRSGLEGTPDLSQRAHPQKSGSDGSGKENSRLSPQATIAVSNLNDSGPG